MDSAPLLKTMSASQQAALDAIITWYEDGGRVPLTLGGLAGSGKSTLVSLLPAVLPDARIAYAAYTGKAVSVLRGKLGGDSQVTTLHRLLYSPVSCKICTESGEIFAEPRKTCPDHSGRPEPCPARMQVSFSPKPFPLDGLDLVVADEASMIPGRLWADLTSHGVPILAVGDHGQLPPVQSGFSLMASPDLRLEEIHRQNAEDPAGMAILNAARWAREAGHIPHGIYGPGVMKIFPHELGHLGLHPAEADLIICATNRTRQWHNAAMRNWHGRSGPPQPGDVVICLRNDYEKGLFNGQRGTVTGTGGEKETRGEPALELAIEMDGRDGSWTGMTAAAQFGAPGTLSHVHRDLALFDWGYAITCHKAQASQAEKVLVIEEGWPPVNSDMRRRWLYTSVTRAESALTVVGW